MKYGIGIAISAFPAFVLFAQKAKVELSIEPTRIEVGETISITITSNVDGTIELDNLPSTFVQDYGISQGSQDKINYSTGEVETTFYYSYSGSITKAGKYTIGPVYVKSYNKLYTSNKVQITVDPRTTSGSSNHVTQKQMKDPAFGIIECNKTEIYEGEAVLFVAKVYSQFDPSHISGYQNYSVPGTVNKFPQGNLNNIKVSKEQIHKKSYFAFQYDKNVVFPSGVGKIHVDPFQLNLHQGYKSFPITSGGFNLIIKPLPSSPPASFIGAVGVFSVHTSVDSTEVKQGNVFTYSIQIKGVGNLNNLQDPKLVLPKGMLVYGDAEREENYTIGSNGAEGEVIFNFHIQALRKGKSQLPALEIAYFDPKKEKYITIQSSNHQIAVQEDPSFKELIAETDKQNEDLHENKNVESKTPKEPKEKSSLWEVLAIGIPSFSIAGLLLILLFRKKKNKANTPKAEKAFDRTPNVLAALKNVESNLKGENEVFFTGVQLVINELFLSVSGNRESILTQSEMENLLRNLGKASEIKRLHHLNELVIQNKYGMSQTSFSQENILVELKDFVAAISPSIERAQL
jgi:hypothetical protein